MMTTGSFSPSAPAVTACNAGVAGMTGECCQIPWSVTGSSRRISHTPFSCLPLILPLPIIVNQSAIVSTGGSCTANDCQGSGVRREACSMPASLPIHQHGGPPGAPLQRLPGQDASSTSETFLLCNTECTWLKSRETDETSRHEEQLKLKT